MGRPTLAFAILASALALAPARADANGHFAVFLGQKSLSTDWEPLEKQNAFGAVMSFGFDDRPVCLAVDVLRSVDENTMDENFLGSVHRTGSTTELDVGVRKVWRQKKVFPYLGGGVGIVRAAMRNQNRSGHGEASDTGKGFWADTGVFFRTGKSFEIGLDLRYSTAAVDLSFQGFNTQFVTQHLNAGGLSYGMLMGFGWSHAAVPTEGSQSVNAQPAPPRAGPNGHFAIFLGRKNLSASDFAPVESQRALGVSLSFGRDDWPVHIAVDLLASKSDTTVQNVSLSGSTFELDLGVRKFWGIGRVFPYLGGGLGRLDVNLHETVNFIGPYRSPLAPVATAPYFLGGDQSFGYWGDTGVLFRVGDRGNLGLDVRYSSADVTLNSTSAPFGQPPAQDVRAAGLTYGLVLGGAW